MFPLILGGIAALLLAGCGSSGKSPEVPAGGETPPDSDPPRDTLLETLHAGLNGQGVSDAELDQGCDLIDYARPGPNLQRINLTPGTVDACEVYQFALDRQARFENLLSGANGAPLPWIINASNRRQVQTAMDAIDGLLRQAKMRSGGEEYQYAMAMGLFYFSMFSSASAVSGAKGNEPKLRQLKLDLAEFEKSIPGFSGWLEKNRGLGILEMSEDAPQEASADQALALKRGKCTEISKILHAVFSQAGLSPYFVYARGKDVGNTFLQWGAKLDEKEKGEMRTQNHVYIGVGFASRQLYFDTNGFAMDEPYPNSYPMKLSHYWAGDLWNQTLDELSGAKRANRFAVLGLRMTNLDPRAPFGHLAKGLGDAMRDEWDASYQHFANAARLDPSSNYQAYLGTALGQRGYPGDRKRAIQLLESALEYNPGDHMARENLDLFYLQEGFAGVLR